VTETHNHECNNNQQPTHLGDIAGLDVVVVVVVASLFDRNYENSDLYEKIQQPRFVLMIQQ
jgi:hypothetical protein